MKLGIIVLRQCHAIFRSFQWRCLVLAYSKCRGVYRSIMHMPRHCSTSLHELKIPMHVTNTKIKSCETLWHDYSILCSLFAAAMWTSLRIHLHSLCGLISFSLHLTCSSSLILSPHTYAPNAGLKIEGKTQELIDTRVLPERAVGYSCSP